MVALKRRLTFRTMPAAQQRAIAGMGGRAAHAMKHAHEWTSAEAREAGKKGGRQLAANLFREGRLRAARRWAPEKLETELVAAYPELFK